MTVTLPLLILFGLVIVIALQITHLRKAGAPVTVQEMGDVRSSLIKLQGAVEALERAAKDDFSRLRLELGGQNQAFKLEIAAALKQISDQLIQRLDSANSDGNQKIELLRRSIAESGAQLQMQVSGELEKLRSGVSQANEQIRAAINERLEQMRHTVDEKLQKTLDSRLNESFRTVTEQLTAVHTGLGEMKSLASGVGDLKRVLTNVKARGTWGEVQLGALLEEMLRPEQYQRNAAVTGTNERVEFAIRLPGGEDGQPRWLPIDAKFPMEDYQRILEASEAGDPVAVEKASRGWRRRCAIAPEIFTISTFWSPRPPDLRFCS
jgi:DNA recombination protein RmuC